MNINVSILEQMLEGEIERNASLLPYPNDKKRRKSAAFVIFCMAKRLGKTIEEVLDWFTDGGQDAGVDGLYFEATNHGELYVSLFQGKYYTNLDGKNAFSENAVEKVLSTIYKIFDPSKGIDVNDKLRPKLEEVRSFIRDGYVPVVHVILCSNGESWNKHTQSVLDAAQLPQNQVTWEHFNHDSIISLLRTPPVINIGLQLRGKSIYEKYKEKNVLIGKVNVAEIARLMDTYGNCLLEGNIRRFLGITAINATLMDLERRDDFYFLNNGITIVCNKMSYNALQQEDHLVKLDDARIINGGQTSKTIAKALHADANAQQNFSTCFVLLRIYEINDSDKDIIRAVTLATNSQNPVDLSVLHSNDDCQKELEIGLKQLGFTYRRHKEYGVTGSDVLASSVVAEAALAIWRYAPHQAKYRRSEHLGTLYEKIFTGLNPAQAAIGVLIFRHVDNLRKRPESKNPPNFLPYATHYIAMILGMELQKICGEVTMQTYQQCRNYLEQNFLNLYAKALEQITLALKDLYREISQLSLQQLAATFRRGDLIQAIVHSVNGHK
ncbi:MAG: AIPR family protein [Desulfovibrionaceae bacterium]|nr:AIPR family protein [Desulfovibrionaceae bacterium]